MVKTYTNGDITVFWDREKCRHAAFCVANLPSVFNVNERPWINIRGATSKEIAQVVDLCPSGALTYTWNKE